MDRFALALVAWAFGLVGLATSNSAIRSSAEPLVEPDECAGCFAENRRLAGRIEQLEQLLARVERLEVELVTERANERGACASPVSRLFLPTDADACRVYACSPRPAFPQPASLSLSLSGCVCARARLCVCVCVHARGCVCVTCVRARVACIPKNTSLMHLELRVCAAPRR
jgi:hypothetical protein